MLVVLTSMSQMVLERFNILVHFLAYFALYHFARSMNGSKMSDDDLFAMAGSSARDANPRIALFFEKLFNFFHFGMGTA